MINTDRNIANQAPLTLTESRITARSDGTPTQAAREPVICRMSGISTLTVNINGIYLPVPCSSLYIPDDLEAI